MSKHMLTAKCLTLATTDLPKYTHEYNKLVNFKRQLKNHPNDKLIEQALDNISNFGLALKSGVSGDDAFYYANIHYSSACADEHRMMANDEDSDDKQTDLQEAKDCDNVSNKYCDDPDLLDPTPVKPNEAIDAINYTLEHMPRTIDDILELDLELA